MKKQPETAANTTTETADVGAQEQTNMTTTTETTTTETEVELITAALDSGKDCKQAGAEALQRASFRRLIVGVIFREGASPSRINALGERGADLMRGEAVAPLFDRLEKACGKNVRKVARVILGCATATGRESADLAFVDEAGKGVPVPEAVALRARHVLGKTAKGFGGVEGWRDFWTRAQGIHAGEHARRSLANGRTHDSAGLAEKALTDLAAGAADVRALGVVYLQASRLASRVMDGADTSGRPTSKIHDRGLIAGPRIEAFLSLGYSAPCFTPQATESAPQD